VTRYLYGIIKDPEPRERRRWKTIMLEPVKVLNELDRFIGERTFRDAPRSFKARRGIN
jgi:hypothetical protein